MVWLRGADGLKMWSGMSCGRPKHSPTAVIEPHASNLRFPRPAAASICMIRCPEAGGSALWLCMLSYVNSSRCLSAKSLQLVGTETDLVVLKLVFPVLFVFGVVGNAVNFLILCSEGMRNRANDLLAAVCLADLAFFLLMLPHSTASFDMFSQNMSFRLRYFLFRQELSALANWASASAIWCMFAVTVERYQVVRTPLRSRSYWSKEKRAATISSIFVFTFLITLYHHLEYDCQLVFFCNFNQVLNFCYSAGSEAHPSWPSNSSTVSPSEWRKQFIRISTVVGIPILAVTILTMLLIRRLHTNDMVVLHRLDSSIRRSVNRHQMHRRRVTRTVVTIASFFAITQGPSAIFSVWEVVIGYSTQNRAIFHMMSVANGLVMFGKSINFVLLCLSSAHFRAKCLGICVRKFPEIRNTSWVKRMSTRSDRPIPSPIPYRHRTQSMRLNRTCSGRSETLRSQCHHMEPLAEVSADFEDHNQHTI